MPAFYSQLDNESLLLVSGPDAATFLQGQLTCDVRAVDTGRAAPGAWCNAQGRVIADLMLVQSAAEHYLLRLRAGIAAPTAERLAKYVVFSKASVNLLDNWRVLACWGEDAAEALRPLVGALPQQRFAVASSEGAYLVQVDEAGQAFELYISPDATALASALPAKLEEQSADAWLALQIKAGLGRVEAATVEEFLPQMLNYDLCGMVSFQKGCYTGQEVIARLHYRGQAKRRTFRARAETDTAPAAGTALFTSGATQAAGYVVNAISTGDGHSSLLASVALKSREEALHLGSGEGPLLTLSAPDYLDLDQDTTGEDD